MNELNLSPISRIESNANLPEVKLAHSAAAGQEPMPQPAQTKPVQEKPVEQPAPKPAKSGPDVFLRFQVNQETKKVTVYVVDRATREIVRTIPPDEINKLKAGDLLELLA